MGKSLYKVGFANSNWGTPQPRDQFIVNTFQQLQCHLIGLVEVKVDALAKMFNLGIYTVYQVMRGKPGQNNVGAAYSHGLSVQHTHLRMGSPAVNAGRLRMPPRWLLIIDIDGVRNIICHFPPKRDSALLWHAFFISLRIARFNSPVRGAYVILSDFNMPPHEAAARLGNGAHSYTVESEHPNQPAIDGAVCGPKVVLSNFTTIKKIQQNGSTDHYGFTAEVVRV